MPGREAPARDRSRLLVVHEQATFGEALARRLGDEDGFDVVGAVSRPLRALVLVPARQVDACVLDWDLAGGAAATLAADLRTLDRPPLVVAVGETRSPVDVVSAFRAGVRGWVPKDAGIGVLLDALRRTLSGQAFLPDDLVGPVLDHVVLRQEASADGPLDVLTARELDVLRCMVAGLGQADIAARLYLSPNTVRTHRRRTLAKLGVHTSLEAVFVARRAGLTAGLPSPALTR